MEPDAVPESPDRLRLWAERISTSPLYRHLANEIAGDPEVFAVVAAMEHTPRGLLFLAAVHDLLLAGTDDDLAGWYPSLTSEPHPIDAAYPPFRRFVLEHHDDLLRRGRKRYVQTNEVQRCALLLPALSRAARSIGDSHLVDVGTSAGLNLCFDRYGYAYHSPDHDIPAVTWGEAGARPLLTCESRGDRPRVEPAIGLGRRIGVDLHPVDPADPDDRRWLEALIWPEHHDRRARLQEALDAARPVERIAGNAVEVLPDVLAGLPADEPAVVMHSFALNQFDEAMRRDLDAILVEARRERPLVRIGLEHWALEDEASRLRYDRGDGWIELGTAQPHGEWIHLHPSPLPVDAV